MVQRREKQRSPHGTVRVQCFGKMESDRRRARVLGAIDPTRGASHRMNGFQQWVIDGLRILMRQGRHTEKKIDILLEHLGAQLPREVIETAADLETKTQALQAALDAQASQPTTKEQ